LILLLYMVGEEGQRNSLSEEKRERKSFCSIVNSWERRTCFFNSGKRGEKPPRKDKEKSGSVEKKFMAGEEKKKSRKRLLLRRKKKRKKRRRSETQDSGGKEKCTGGKVLLYLSIGEGKEWEIPGGPDPAFGEGKGRLPSADRGGEGVSWGEKVPKVDANRGGRVGKHPQRVLFPFLIEKEGLQKERCHSSAERGLLSIDQFLVPF